MEKYKEPKQPLPENIEKQIILLEKELSSIRERARSEGKLVYREDGSFEYALAPNGEKSNLTEKQWLQVRTSFFKKWFGDWENDKENASKLLDENGEPRVFYHGTTRKFTTFSHKAYKNFDLNNVEGAFYLTSSKEFALSEYANFKWNLIRDMLGILNTLFFEGKGGWKMTIEKWNDFIKSIGTEKVDFRKKVPNGRGGYYNWTVVEYDGKTLLSTDEMEKLWDGKVPVSFNPEEYDELTVKGYPLLVPKNVEPIVMSLFVRSIHPNYKKIPSNGNIFLMMDDLFYEGLLEKGILRTNRTGEDITKISKKFGSKPETDSIVIELYSGALLLAVFHPNQLKSADTNVGLFSIENDDINY